MAGNSLSVFCLSLVLSIALCSCRETPTTIGQIVQKRFKGWCVINTGAPEDKIQAFLDYYCHEFDCSPILPGGGCYKPNSLLGHGSWILNTVYKAGGFCEKGLGFITQFNPSYDGCTYA